MNEQVGPVTAPRVRIVGPDDIPAALDDVGLQRERPVIALVGGAGGMSEQDLATVAEVLRTEVVPLADRRGAVVVDGGTDSGVMRLIGRARAAAVGRFPLVGVAVDRTVIGSGAVSPVPDAAELEPHHTLFLLVPGTQWGDEAGWIGDVARVVAGSRSSVTLLVTGGPIAYDDVAVSLRSGRPVVVLAGSGRAADAIARARAGDVDDHRAVAIAASPLTRVVDVAEAGAVAAAIEAALEVD
jgi:hypothetical protein